MTPQQDRNPLIAVSGLIVSMALLAFGNGLMFAYVPIKLAILGHEPSVAGWMLTAMAGGGLLGCLACGWFVRAVGHARAFMALAAVAILSYAVLALSDAVIAWGIARGIYGFAVTGVFIVSQTWLNSATPNRWRGRVLSIFYAAYVFNIGLGGFSIGFIPLEGTAAPVLAIVLVALSIVAAGTTSLPVPRQVTRSPVSLGVVWRHSPIALAGALTVGGLTSLVQGFAPIYADSEGFSPQKVGLLLLLMQLGMFGIQTPMGVLSDRIDRRVVLLLAAGLVAAASAFAWSVTALPYWAMVLVFAIWAGATESIFSVSNAHANDRVQPENALTMTTTLMFAWSISGFVAPLAATLLTAHFGNRSFMITCACLGLLLMFFILLRLVRASDLRPTEKERHAPGSSQAPFMPELLQKRNVR